MYYNGSTKFRVVVEEGWPMWDKYIPSLGYQVVHIYTPLRFRRFLQGGNLGGAEWIPLNQVGKSAVNTISGCLCLARRILSGRCGDGGQTSVTGGNTRMIVLAFYVLYIIIIC